MIQREREALAKQLRSAGTEQLERMSSEVASLRATAAEMAVVRESAERHRCVVEGREGCHSQKCRVFMAANTTLNLILL